MMAIIGRVLVISALAASATACGAAQSKQGVKGRYVNSNGLKIYYEVHGAGKPLVLLHGAFATAEGWQPLLPTLTKTRQIIAIELQGHGHTADRDTPLSFEQMADDTAAVLRELKISSADVFGYSMGGTAALALAIRHPSLVGKLAILGSGTGSARDTYDPATYKQMKSMTPQNFNFPVLKDPYTRVAPDPSKWPVLVAKLMKMEDDFKGFPAASVKSIKAQTLIMMGDRDAVLPEHAVEVFRLIPNSKLAIFPGGDHFMLFTSTDKILATLVPFLDAK